MTIVLTDTEIDLLIAEPKTVAANFRARLNTRIKKAQGERDLELSGLKGSRFKLLLRQSLIDALDFTVGLLYQPPSHYQWFRLRRYNGNSHSHTNRLADTYNERKRIYYKFHIHYATERYQAAGFREDSYAEETDQYTSFDGALECMLRDCGFDVPPDNQTRMF